MTQNAALEAKVRGVNRANKMANEIYHKLVNVFGKFVGEKIEKNDGTLLKKVQIKVDSLNLPKSNNESVWQWRCRHGSGDLVYCIKTCERKFGRAYYHETRMYVGGMKNGVLVNIQPPPEFKTDYTVKEVQSLRAKYEAAKKIADEAENKLFPFGKWNS